MPFITPETFSPNLPLGNHCHLWLLDLTQLPEDLIARQQVFLSRAELQRLQTIKQRQAQFIAIRAFVRLCLARYTHSRPQDLVIATQKNGKPYLVNPVSPLVFNLSHSQDMAVFAVGMEHALGVDIESVKRKGSQRDIAERYFHQAEVAQLNKLSGTEQANLFFRLWTLKEAFLKATGEGISGGLDKIAFDLQGEGIKVTFARESNTRVQEWQFFQAFINPDYCVALARNSGGATKVYWLQGRDLFV